MQFNKHQCATKGKKKDAYFLQTARPWRLNLASQDENGQRKTQKEKSKAKIKQQSLCSWVS